MLHLVCMLFPNKLSNSEMIFLINSTLAFCQAIKTDTSYHGLSMLINREIFAIKDIAQSAVADIPASLQLIYLQNMVLQM